jgi:O-antigen/teichoic acid export membrane protein
MTTPAAAIAVDGGRKIAQNAVINIAGEVCPALVAIVAVPILLRHLGIDRFGLLGLAWMVVGYFGLLDMGLGRALTHAVARRLGQGERQELGDITWTALAIMAALGVCGGLALMALDRSIVERFLHIPIALQSEARATLWILAAAIPMTIVSTGLRGILQAQQRFGWVNAIRAPQGIFNFAAPLAILPFSSSLVPVVAVLAVGRALGMVAFLLVCLRVTPELRRFPRVHRTYVRELFGYGGWIMASNLMAPLLSSWDRIVIGGMLPISAIGYYTAPQEVISKTGILAASLGSVLFPSFAAHYAANSRYVALTLERALKATFFIMFPVVLVAVAFAPEGLRLWLGASFAAHSATALRLLALGVLLNSFNQSTFALMQGCGRPDFATKLQGCVLLAYAPLSVYLIHLLGIEGAACAVIAQFAMQFGGSVYSCRKLVPEWPWSGIRKFALLLLLGGVALVPPVLLGTAIAKLCYVIAILVVFAGASWSFVFSSQERDSIMGMLLRKVAHT